MVMKLIEVVREKKLRKDALKKMSMESSCTNLCVCVHVCYYNQFVTPNIIFFWVSQIGYMIEKFK
jgi:hypothetical protein